MIYCGKTLLDKIGAKVAVKLNSEHHYYCKYRKFDIMRGEIIEGYTDIFVRYKLGLFKRLKFYMLTEDNKPYTVYKFSIKQKIADDNQIDSIVDILSNTIDLNFRAKMR